MMKRTHPKAKKRAAVFSIKAIIVWSIVLLVLYFLFLAGSHNFPRYWRQRAQKKQLLQEIDSLQAQKEHLKKEANRLKTDPDYIEKIAREKYNMKKKGEKVYRIIKGK